MKKIITAALIAAAAIALTACSTIDAGEITAKKFEPEHTYTTYSCVQYDKNGICKIQMPQQNHVEDRYRFNLEDGDQTGWVYVPQSTYDEYQVGDWYGAGE
ncbi:hypothetical protein ACFVAJ_19165 [Agromyces sp. NPDC057679]|uniref:hypothetical protein n=1 Tax=Agromyces sp. NPDC057679 TaxID=3346207 RepID=UPI00366A5BCB